MLIDNLTGLRSSVLLYLCLFTSSYILFLTTKCYSESSFLYLFLPVMIKISLKQFFYGLISLYYCRIFYYLLLVDPLLNSPLTPKFGKYLLCYFLCTIIMLCVYLFIMCLTYFFRHKVFHLCGSLFLYLEDTAL